MSAAARLARLPLRRRLVGGFALAMAVVLLASGAFVYWRVAFALDRRLDSDLVDESANVRALLQPDGTLQDASRLGSTPALSNFQVLAADGSVVSSGPGLGRAPVLTAPQLAAARAGVVTVELGSMLPVSDRPFRLRAEPVSDLVLVVAVRRDTRDEALRELLVQLAVAGLGTLVITTFVGDRLARAALRPVERYRVQAAQVTTGATGLRLDVPPERDDEVTRLGHTLNTMLDALERSLDRERRFLQDASHELRTPLTLLRTRTQVALSRPRSPEELTQTLRELDTDVRELSALADALLRLGTLAETGAAPAGVAAPGDVAAVLRGLHARTGAGPDDTGLPASWSLTLPEATPPVGLPEAQVRQVVHNLLVNAALHGHPPVEVDVRVADGGQVVVLTVHDAGDELTAADLPRAAERFRRSEHARSRPGAGLGLSLVLALLDPAGGELRLCSDGAHQRYRQRFDVACAHPGAGTTASVLLPVATKR